MLRPSMELLLHYGIESSIDLLDCSCNVIRTSTGNIRAWRQNGRNNFYRQLRQCKAAFFFCCDRIRQWLHTGFLLSVVLDTHMIAGIRRPAQVFSPAFLSWADVLALDGANSSGQGSFFPGGVHA